MSKFVKSLMMDDLRKRLEGVDNALLVSVSGLNAIKNNKAHTPNRLLYTGS